jgi:hypothetical protein
MFFIPTLPKSGTAYLSLSLQGLTENSENLCHHIAPPPRMNTLASPPPDHFIDLDQKNIIKYFTTNFDPSKINISLNHYQAEKQTLEIMSKLSEKVLIQIRDPRQAFISLIHHMAKRDFSEKVGYEFQDLNILIDEGLKKIFPRSQQFISDWVAAQNKNDFGLQIEIINFAEYKEDPIKYFIKVFDFLGINHSYLSQIDTGQPKVGEKHFRKGEDFEFMYVLSDQQLAIMNTLASNHKDIYSKFNWPSIEKIECIDSVKFKKDAYDFMRSTEIFLHALRYLITPAHDCANFAEKRQKLITLVLEKQYELFHASAHRPKHTLLSKIYNLLMFDVQYNDALYEEKNIPLNKNDLEPGIFEKIPNWAENLFCKVSLNTKGMYVSIFYTLMCFNIKVCYLKIDYSKDVLAEELKDFSFFLKTTASNTSAPLFDYTKNYLNIYNFSRTFLLINSTQTFKKGKLNGLLTKTIQKHRLPMSIYGLMEKWRRKILKNKENFRKF